MFLYPTKLVARKHPIAGPTMSGHHSRMMDVAIKIKVEVEVEVEYEVEVKV